MTHAIPITGPYDFTKHLRYAARNPLEPVDHVDWDRREWSRVLLARGEPVLVRVTEQPAGTLAVHLTPEPSDPAARREVVARVGHVFAADADARPFEAAHDPATLLGRLVAAQGGLKPFRTDGAYEALLWAVLAQQLTLTFAYRLKLRLVERWGVEADGRRGWPRPRTLAAADPDALRGIGLSRRKVDYLQGVARAETDGHLRLEGHADDDARQALLALRGVGPWTAEYALLRGLGRDDALPAEDVGLWNAAAAVLGLEPRPDAPGLRRLAEAWRPHRGWAAFHLWFTFVPPAPPQARCTP